MRTTYARSLSGIGRPAVERGFTLVELVCTAAIAAILATFAAPRFFDNRVFIERGYADEVAAAIRHAQRTAIASGCNVRFTLGAAGYAAAQRAPAGVVCDPAGAWTTPVLRTDGTPLAAVAPAGVAANPAVQFEFAPDGAPLAAPPVIAIGAFAISVDGATGRTTAAP